MATLPTLFVPEDKLGTSPANLITDEIHELSTGSRIIKLNLCAYYTDSIIVKAISNTNQETTLTKAVNYTCTEHFSTLSARTGKEVCGSILLNPDVQQTKFKITYQAYGGYSNPHIRALAGVVVSHLQNTSVNWNNLLDKPKFFTPKAHLHDWLDLYGLEFIVTSLNRLATSLSQPQFDELKTLLKANELINNYEATNRSNIVLTHTSNTSNPHNVTKAQVGLGNVENLEVLNNYTELSTSNSQSSYYNDFFGTTNSKYVTNYSVKQFISEYIAIIYASFFTVSNAPKVAIEQAIEALNAKLASIRTSLTAASAAIGNLNQNNLIDSRVSTWLKKYKHVYWNEELARVLKAITLKHYTVEQSYDSIIDVPGKLELPQLWLDFSDASTLEVTNNKVKSIKDKSLYSRIFTQLDDQKQPSLISKTSSSGAELSRNKVSSMVQGKYLSLPIGEFVELDDEFTIIVLAKTNTTTCPVLSSTNSSNLLSIHSGSRAIELSTNQLNIKAPQSSSDNSKTLLSVLSANTNNLSESWIATNKPNNSSYSLGIDTKEKVGHKAMVFDSIGVNTNSLNYNYELAEVMIYDRQLSTSEIDALNVYFSKKWVGSSNINLDLSFIEANI